MGNRVHGPFDWDLHSLDQGMQASVGPAPGVRVLPLHLRQGVGALQVCELTAIGVLGVADGPSRSVLCTEVMVILIGSQH